MYTFKDEITACIRLYNTDAEIVDGELIGRTVHVSDKNIVFHLLPVPFAALRDIEPEYFQEKSLEYASRGIQLVHLWNDYWMTKQAIVHSRIAAISGSFVRVAARKTLVRRITRDVMFEFFATNHLQGFVDARYNYGLFTDEKLVAAASFSPGRNIMRDGLIRRSFELVRFANLLHYRVSGGLGKIMARFIKDVTPDDIMTYADLDWASGIGYKTLNFSQTGVTKPQTYWLHPRYMMRIAPHRLPQRLTEDFNRQNNYDNIDDFLKDRKYVKIYNAGSIKYLLVLDRMT